MANLNPLAPNHPLPDWQSQIALLREQQRLNIEISHRLDSVQLFAARGQADKVCQSLGIGNNPGKASINEHFTAMPLSPGQWLLVGDNQLGDEFVKQIANRVQPLGYVSNQTSSRVRFRISGPNAGELMMRGCTLDLTQFSKGDCAQTVIVDIGVVLYVQDCTPCYDLMVYSGYAQCFWEWICHTARRFQ